MIERAQQRAGGPLHEGVVERAGAHPDGDWVVSLDVDEQRDQTLRGELAVRALAAAVVGTRTYVSARAYGYSFTVILGGVGAQVALGEALTRLEAAQSSAGLPTGGVVCAEVTLVGSRPVPAAVSPQEGCENAAS